VSKLSIYLRLGRVSNLPTVWTNALAGATLAGADASAGTLVALAVLLSAFYVGGMFLNDAFDADLDRRDRPERPIPSGQIGAREVFAIGFGLLAVAIVGLAWFGGRAAVAGGGLAFCIVLYDSWHKDNPLSPVIMGACRALVYVIAALAVAGGMTGASIAGALALWSYLIGLTYIAKQENLLEVKNLWPALFVAPAFIGLRADPLSIALHLVFLVWTFGTLPLLLRRQKGDIPKAVLRLLAGICLLDAAAVAAESPARAVIALACFALTRRLHRAIAGT
jgi:hypothetical protein